MAPRNRRDFETAIICALQLEADAVEALFDKIYENSRYGQILGDDNTYTLGKIQRHTVVLAWMPRMGKSNAAGVAANLKTSFTNISLALLVGVCAGVPFPLDSEGSEIILGDVIISRAVVEYDSGRRFPDRFQRKDTLLESLGPPPLWIKSFVQKLSGLRMREILNKRILEYLPPIQERLGPKTLHPGPLEDRLFRADYRHKHRRSEVNCNTCAEHKDSTDPVCNEAETTSCQIVGCEDDKLIARERLVGSKPPQPAIHFGLVASADTVMRSGQERDRIAKQEAVIAFEMEGAGVWEKLPCLIVKGVCDYADSHKNKVFQRYAATTAAVCAKGLLQELPVRADKPPTWSVPFERNEHIVGRASELMTLEESLCFSQDRFTKYAVHGLGGTGKTQLALEIAYRTWEKNGRCSIFWVPAGNLESFRQAYQDIGEQLKLPGIEEKGADVLSIVKKYFCSEEAGEWLMIFDNADSLDLWSGSSASTDSDAFPLRHYVPISSYGRALMTTRDEKVALKFAKKRNIHLEVFDEQTSHLLMHKLVLNESMLDDIENTKKLLEQLDHLPLAIVQAAAYLNEHRQWINIEQYLSILEGEDEISIKLLAEDFDDDGRYANQKNPVALTWLVSFRKIRRQRPLATEYLSHMSCLESKAIPTSFLPEHKSFKQYVEAMSTLTAYSFISKRTDQTVDIHRLVHTVTRNWLKLEQCYTERIQKTLCCVAVAFRDLWTEENRINWRVYIPHVQCILNRSKGQVELDPDSVSARLLGDYGFCLLEEGRSSEAEEVFSRQLRIRQLTLGNDHPKTLTSMAYVAAAYREQNRHLEAGEIELKVLESRRRVLGETDPMTLVSMRTLAAIHDCQGEYQKADDLRFKALGINQEVHGLDHWATLEAMMALAQNYRLRGQLEEAEKYVLPVLEGRKRVFGTEHEQTIMALLEVWLLCKDQGRLVESKALGHELLALSRKVEGPEHATTMFVMTQLADLHLKMGDLQEAAPLMRGAVELSIKVLGETHPDTLERVQAFEQLKMYKSQHASNLDIDRVD